MVKRKKIIAGNWKMNLCFEEADELLFSLNEKMGEQEVNCDLMIVCPPFPYLEMAGDFFIEDEKVFIGAQNSSEEKGGAYTGEISAEMLSSLDIEYCILGHSERRKYFKETDEQILKKAQNLLDNNIQPIICCGELLEEREKNKHFEVIKNQLKKAVIPLKEKLLNVVVAYEPVWAIGTGKTATPQQAQEIHAFIRSYICEELGEEIGESISILYGGSCKPSNAKELFQQKDVDGGLIGGASLDVNDFIQIANSF
jgi:triosephosphate isomerase (TIM)